MPAVVAQPSAGRRSLARLLRTSSPSTFLDPKLWNLVAFAERLGVLAEMALRLPVALFTRLEPEHQQHMVVVPSLLISQSPLLPTLAIATHAAAGALGFVRGRSTRRRDCAAQASAN